MSEHAAENQRQEPPAMGERRARWGYGYQDKVATERILNLLRTDLREGAAAFEGVRLADLEAGRVDDFVLIWGTAVEGNSIKSSEAATPINWGDIVGASGLLKELADGYKRLRDRWPNRTVSVRLHTNRPPSVDKHHAQLISTFSVAEFLRKHWRIGPTADDSTEVRDVWTTVGTHVGLSGAALSEFISSCELSLGFREPPGRATDSLDWRHYLTQFESLHKALATTLTNSHDHEFLDRDFLLSAIGFRPSRSGLVQRFPQPLIPYERNHAAADRLTALVDGVAGGYIAVTGVAGIGKSTLVQDVLADSEHPFFVPYYAFLPNTDGNRDRGEALTFFQDVVGRLDRFVADRHSIGIGDVAQGRDALRRHMSKAHERFVLQRSKTILLVDGLDHVSREVNLQTPVLHELPHPDEVPDGFLIILSAQPQALLPGIIPAAVANAVAQTDRRIELSGLTRIEIHDLVSKASKSTTGPQRDALHQACLGNPLILSYVLTEFERSADTTVEKAIELAGHYRGPIDDYYREVLAVQLQDSTTRRLLGLLCRAAPTIPVAWLQEWPERDQIGEIYSRVIAPFVRIEGGSVHFIHDSLIAFLKSETRSQLPGSDAAIDERAFHSALAERCNGRPCQDALGRSRVLHLLRAERHADLLNLLSSDWLRRGVEGFLPYALIRPLLVSGLGAAWVMAEFGHVLRLTLLDHELDQRTSRLEAGRLAEILLDLDEPGLAVLQIRAVGRMLVDDQVGIHFAAVLWRYAERFSRADLKATARELYLQTKPISLIYERKPIDAGQHRDHFASLRAWAASAPLFEELSGLIGEIERFTFTGSDEGKQVDTGHAKATLLFEVLGTVIDDGIETPYLQSVVDAIARLDRPTWRFAALLRLAEARPSADLLDDLELARRDLVMGADTDLALGRLLFDQHRDAAAREILGNLHHVRFEPFRGNHRWGFSDITYTVTLRCLQQLLGLPEGPVPGVDNERDEAPARVESAARRLGLLLAAAKGGSVIPEIDASLRAILLFHNSAVRFPAFSHHTSHVVTTSKSAIYREVATLAACVGIKGVDALRRVFSELVCGPAGDQFTAGHRRELAGALFTANALSGEQAANLGLSSTDDSDDEDPTTRQEACLEIATFLHSLARNAESQGWMHRASEVSAGAGSHKDYHMAHVAAWLSRSILDTASGSLALVDKFVRSVQVAGGRGGSDGANEALQVALRMSPFRAAGLAVELIDRGVLNVADTVEALIVGGARVGASPEALQAMYCELHALIASGNTASAAVAMLQTFAATRRASAAAETMTSVRTQALPSHRVEVARALQDALLQSRLDAPVLTRGLREGRDDSSSKSALYRLASGECETTGGMAVRLSDDRHPEEWNPNPGENTEFEWWAAIKKASVTSRAHLETLLSVFPPPDYREVERLALRATAAGQMGDRRDARQLARDAIARAKDGSWHPWLDGAEKRIAYSALKGIDRDEAVTEGRAQFGKDLGAGRLNSSFLLSDIPDTLDVLDIEWPADAVRVAIGDYLDHVLAANQKVQAYGSLTGPASECSPDASLCRFAVHLLAFPVIDVGIAARRVLARYFASQGDGIVELLTSDPCWDSVQLEHLLAAVHTGSSSNTTTAGRLRHWVAGLNDHESVAVRSIARRICQKQGWAWEEISNQTAMPTILLAGGAPDDRDAPMLLNHDVARAFALHRGLFLRLENVGLDPGDIRSEFERLYLDVERAYAWADDSHLKRWMAMVLARFWLNPRMIVGREAAMRLVGRRSLSGQIPPGAEVAYDHFYPIYDPDLDLLQAAERPATLEAMEWRLADNREHSWLKGGDADSWSDYPDFIEGLQIIGERSWFVRPEWEWPREERRRGLTLGPSPPSITREALDSSLELTYEFYKEGRGQDGDRLVVFNSERHLVGPAYRWAAINAQFARALGWIPSGTAPFEWVDASGRLAVKSVYWKDGWIWLEPPKFESLGEGWLVLATSQAIEAIRDLAQTAELHLWIERHSHGDKPYEGKWHLSKLL